MCAIHLIKSDFFFYLFFKGVGGGGGVRNFASHLLSVNK